MLGSDLALYFHAYPPPSGHGSRHTGLTRHRHRSAYVGSTLAAQGTPPSRKRPWATETASETPHYIESTQSAKRRDEAMPSQCSRALNGIKTYHWLTAPLISVRISDAAVTGSGACVMGRPTTRQVAPDLMAAAGVTTRFWSPTSAPAGRMPGTHSTKEGPQAARIGSISFAEQTTPSMPQDWARRARRTTCDWAGVDWPTASRSLSSKLVSTVTASSSGLVVPAAAAASEAAATAAQALRGRLMSAE